MKNVFNGKKLLSVLLTFTIMLSAVNFCVVPVSAASVVCGDYTYEAIDGTYCRLTKYSGTDTEIVIPDTLDGYTVKELANTFYGK
ncbi:MAG: hypothetical protein E7660_07700, partial [Ruminococcaceae bacterium]|nr:hypothetical protein [Oscillospiraceae bacterium]